MIKPRTLRSTSLALLIMILAGLLPIRPAAAQQRATAAGPEQAIAESALKVAPAQAVRTPSLTIHVRTSADTLAVGDTIAVTLTVANHSVTPATNVVVSLPLPAGAEPADTANFNAAAGAWQWTVGQFDGQSSQEFSASLRLTSVPAGAALLARPTVAAAELPKPTSAVGGALVDAPASSGKATFTPGKAATLSASDSRVNVRVPADLAGSDLQLSYSTLAQKRQQDKGFQAPPAVIGFKRGFAPFFLDATDAKGKPVHTFNKPLTISVRYTPEQLEALGIAEADLTIFWYDEAAQQWVPQLTAVDPAARTASIQVNHFSAYGLSDGSSPSEAFIPSLQGWQVSLFTGSANYGMGIDVPAGPTGVKPNLNLSYSSAATDGKGGTRSLGQAGWVGKGWSLDTGSVAYNKLTVNQTTGQFVGYYSMVVNGQSFDVMRGAALTGNTGALDADPTHWTWLATDENFNKISVIPNGFSTSSRGGYENGVAQPRYLWRIWTKDGTRYDFAEDMWWGWNNCGTTTKTVDMETYKWQLSTVTDVHGNTINYTYGRYSVPNGAVETCAGSNNSGQGTRDLDIWPTAITWGSNVTTGATERYKVTFEVSERAYDLDWDGAFNQYGGSNGQPRQTKRLDNIIVYSKPSAAWEQVRRYWLEYDYSLTADNRTSPTERLTLKSVQRIGKDNVSALPKTIFTYDTAPYLSNGTTPNPNWNRLTTVNNGQGGTMAFAYDIAGNAPGSNNTLANNRRVISKTTNDGRTPAATTLYTYFDPATNSLGTILDTTSSPIQQYANSAALYYNEKLDPAVDNSAWLLHAPYGEFRGHSKVIEQAPDNTKTEHYFYQGDVACNPATTAVGTHAAVIADSCFLQMRDREILKGREYKTVTLSAANAVLASTTRTFAVNFGITNPTDYGATPLSGLWRSFSYETKTLDSTYEGNVTPVTKRTDYYYNPAMTAGGGQSDGQLYGNLITKDEYDANNALYRRTKYTYETVNTATQYMVDRLRAETVYNGASTAIAQTIYQYDGNTTTYGLGARGLLTLVHKYTEMTHLLNVPVKSVDTSYAYDAYGNQTTVTTYGDAGTRMQTSGGTLFSAPGNGSPPSVTTTVYDNPATTTVDEAAWGMSLQVILPTVNGVTLTESAAYDYRMGTLNSVTDPNGQVTSAEYDAFGRMVKLIKPGDSSAMPTVLAQYADTEQPFRYTVSERIQSGVSGSVQKNSQFYDGLGRKIQTKTEVDNNATSIVVDTQYNKMGQPYREYRPRLQNDTNVTIEQYTPTPVTGVYSTTNTYDALGRVLTTTTPNGAKTLHTYGIISGQTYNDVVDPNRHRMQYRSDVFGRLVQVDEIAGNCGAYLGYPCGAGDVAWAPDSSTLYTYSPLDLLTAVTDTYGNQTTMTYDTLGRKLTMSDPDMGAWSYTYDVDGNLLTQTDAKNQTITFGYDALSRMTSKAVPGTGTVTYGYDEIFGIMGNYNLGQRTSMTNAAGSYTWSYDERGQLNQETQIINDQNLAYSYTTQRTYLANGQLSGVIYPTGEELTYTYNDAGQQKAIASSFGNTYLTGATYDALGQILTQSYGNGVLTTNNYYAIDARLYNRHITNGGTTLFRRYYTYELGGNVRSTDSVAASGTPAETLRFFYDDRDRLTTACAVSGAASNTCLGGSTFNQTYTYNKIGNLATKAGVTYSYPSNGVRPHAVSSVGGVAYTYDNNGNLLTGGGRTFTWNAENQPTRIVKGTTTEDYAYDGDNTRVLKVSTVAGVTTSTRYVGGLIEVSGTTTVSSYNGIAARTLVGTYSAGNPGNLIYLHGDHLGSVSMTTRGTNEGLMEVAGTVKQMQTFDPWGAVRSGGITATEFNYTGQRKDAGTGLLFYNARYYDPAIGRFLQADSIVPSTSHRSLTVDYHESGFRGSLSGENNQGFRFQMSGRQRQKATAPWGPGNPQELNRFSYVNNNPLKYTDPSGHHLYLNHAEAEAAVDTLTLLSTEVGVIGLVVTAFASGGAAGVVALLESYGVAGAAVLATGAGAALLAALVIIAGIGIGAAVGTYANLAWAIGKSNGDQGVGLAFVDGFWNDEIYVMNSATGARISVGVANYFDWIGAVPDSLKPGSVVRTPGHRVNCRFFINANDGSGVCHGAPVDPAAPPAPAPVPK